MNIAEAIFLAFVQLGAFSIDAEGHLWRHWWYATDRRTRVPVVPPTRMDRDVGEGYYLAGFQWSGVTYHVLAHRVVYMHARRTVLGLGQEINHRNGHPGDNRPENLEAVTKSENMRHAVHVLGRGLGARGDRHHARKLSWDLVLEIRAAVAEGTVSQAALCRKYGVAPATMSQVVNGKTWKHVEASL